MLKYITRGNVNPTGKQKIYYASTVEDKGGINDTSTHILTYYDMAIFYEEDGDTSKTSDDEICSMDCVILLLTEQTMQTDNDVINRILPLAIKNDIPMLPLGITPKVGPLVGEICVSNGYPSLDVLFPNDSDNTKVPFRERLQSWMSKFMTSTEEHQRILDNFQTRIFISYRKKDRQILRKLLDDIYNKTGYHTSLIWFDEYLTAGEDYNIEIQNMIDSSTLFIFLLTENMLEPDNYAIREELSRAIEKNKRILVINTVRKVYLIPKEILQYKNSFIFTISTDSNNCSAMDFSEIGNMLPKMLPDPVFLSKYEELEYLYLLGMAYYLGIGALKNENFGLKLIRYSADEGLIEAMERMVTVLITKFGNYSSAIEYQEKITAHYKFVAGETSKIKDLEAYLDKMVLLGDYYSFNGELEKYEDTFRTIIKIIESIANLKDQKNLLYTATLSCMSLGDIADAKIRNTKPAVLKQIYISEAFEWYISGYKYALNYSEFEDSLKSRRAVYTALMRITDEKHDWTEAPLEGIIYDYLSILKDIEDANKDFPCSDTRADLFACHKALMELFHTVGKSEEAMDNGQKMLDLARQLYQETMLIHRLRTYMEALESFSVLQYEYGHVKEALINLIKASKARSKYMEHPVNDPETAMILFTDYIQIFDLCVKEKRIDDARINLEYAIAVAVNYGLDDIPDVRIAINSRSYL